MAIALIVAAGSGERLQAGIPKALVKLEGKSLLQWSVEALQAAPSVQRIIVALPEGVSAPPGTEGVRGGAVRSVSVREALRAAGRRKDAVVAAQGGDTEMGAAHTEMGFGHTEMGEEADVVLVHDAARPLLTPELAEAVIAAVIAEGVDGAVAAAPVTDTVKRVRDRSVLQTLRREELWAVQTPQAFRRAALEDVLLHSQEEALAQATDDACLIERAGGTVAIVPSSAENLKVTTPLDLELAAMLLARRA